MELDSKIYGFLVQDLWSLSPRVIEFGSESCGV